MNIQHSARNDDWRTPPHIVAMVKEVLGAIDLDPASSEEANREIGAREILTKAEDGLAAAWTFKPDHLLAVYLNPPGGKLRNKSLAALFWQQLMRYWHDGRIRHAIFAAFSVEQLATCQLDRPGCSMLNFPLCVPRKRVQWVDPLDAGRTAPSHSSCFVYVPGALDKTRTFVDVFSRIGKCKV